MVCCVCNDEILDRAMKAGEKFYHEDHFRSVLGISYFQFVFRCSVCSGSLASQETFTRDSLLYCQADYLKLYVPVCGGCGDYIRQECVKAMGQNWHPEHFTVSSPVQWRDLLKFSSSR